jgi:hypothetical protein
VSAKHPSIVTATITALLLACLATSSASASAPAKTGKPGKPDKAAIIERALLGSHELWATIDVCSPANQLDTVGIRGSMPGDNTAGDKMYMSFRLQYENASKQWIDLSSDASSGFVAVGGGASPRQGGTSFELKPVASEPAVTLRGVVDFQWRRGKTVLFTAARTTLAGHRSLAGADPADFSAATCQIG